MEEERKKQQESANACEEDRKGQPIDDQNIGGVVGGRNPFTDLPEIKNQQIDQFVTENG